MKALSDGPLHVQWRRRHGVFTAASIIRAYHRDRGEAEQRTRSSSMFSHPCDAASPARRVQDRALMPKRRLPDLEA
jgi:glycine dehydrogenase subunit 2